MFLGYRKKRFIPVKVFAYAYAIQQKSLVPYIQHKRGHKTDFC